MSFMINRFEYGAKMILFVLAAALPLWFVPVSGIGIDMGREITFGVLILASCILWLLRILSSGEIRFQRSPLLWGALGLLVFFGVSTLLSKAPLVSALFADAGAEKFFSMLALVLLAILAGSVLRRREDAGTLIFILIFSGAVSAALTAVQLLAKFSLLASVAGANGIGATVVGTVNGLSLFYAALLAMTAGVALSQGARHWKAWVRWSLAVAGALFLFDIILVNFLAAWIVLLAFSVFLFGLMTIQNRLSAQAGMGRHETDLPVQVARTRTDWRYWVALVMVVFSVVMIMVRTPLFTGVAFPPEVSPSLSATLSIAGSVFKEGTRLVFFGSGPGTFDLDWARYKDPSLNQTIFWNVGFIQGNSWVATLFATAGVLGTAAFIAFVIGGALLFLRSLLSSYDADGALSLQGGVSYLEDPLAMACILANIAAISAAFLYPFNLSLASLLFLTSGLLTLLLSRRAIAPVTRVVSLEEVVVPADEEGRTEEEMISEVMVESAEGETVSHSPVPGGFWGMSERIISFQTPWAVFLSSLAVIFLLSAGVVGLYMELSHARAAWAVGAGVAAANRGAMDEAIGDLERAASLEDNNFRTYQLLVAVRTEKIRVIIQRATGGENMVQEFQSAVSAAVQDSQKALALHPTDSDLWRAQGALYELIIPFVPGAERLAFSGYQKAAEFSPVDPSVYVDWGRAGLSFTDRIQVAINQAGNDKDRQQLNDARKSNLQQIAQVFQKAIDLKSDYAPAHFLLAQTQIRLGDIDLAITSVENAKLAAPFDIGIAFQLGLLYYQKNDLDKAAAEFARAVSTNENYSNARYFLGLIHDKQGDKDHAIEEFTKISALNPDNQEVKTILENLQAGKSALAGIVPPAPPPEKRKETPVKDTVR